MVDEEARRWLEANVGAEPLSNLFDTSRKARSVLAEATSYKEEARRIATRATELRVADLPVGSIIAWHKDMPGTPPELVGWAPCNGQEVTDDRSPFHGKKMPDLNNQGLFLRGSASSGTTQRASQVAVTLETNSGKLYFDASGRNMTRINGDFDETLTLGPNQRGFVTRVGVENVPGQTYAGRVRPKNMSVVWIMRIW